MKINGGQRAGNNLFHSFEEFNIPEGMEAAFENATDIENIFTRVTGDSVSAIDGILSAQGGANLFLMNPNGIVFGTDASINVGGSFIATTADNIQFGEGQEFAASEAENDALINVRFPIAFGFNQEPGGSITVNGAGSEARASLVPSPIETADNKVGLSVLSGKTLALIGNKIDVNGGIVTSEGGDIEVASVDRGNAGVQPTEGGLNFNYDDIKSSQNITLRNQALFNSNGKGKISLTGANIELTDGSLILTQNTDLNSPENILIKASELLVIKGATKDRFESPSGLRTEALGKGNGSNIKVSAENLLLEDKGSINTLTFNEGKSGSIDVDVINSSKLSGSFQSLSNSSVLATTYADGDSGNVRVSTEKLTAVDGSVISSSSFGTGNAGNVVVEATDIRLSGIGSNTVPTGITANAFNFGESGNLTIDTSSLRLDNGATVNSTSLSGSTAGNITINASDFINISGNKLNFSSTVSSSVVVVNEDIVNRFGIPEIPSSELGDSGNVTINTPVLNIAQEGSVSVRNLRTGSAGTLSIDAEQVDLDNSGSITATTVSGTGGNIELNTGNLQINSESQITATAGSEGGGGNININATNISAKKNSVISANAEGGDGGNITIDTETLLGLQNSDITANAIEGDGGNITITADAIVGFDERARLTDLSDITASSDFGASGTITIDSPESSSDEELEVAAREVESSNLAKDFVESCSQGRGKFTYTAMGIPQNPDRYFDDSGEYGAEEVSDVTPNYPPIGFPQSEQQKRDIERLRQNRSRREQGQVSPKEVQGQMIVTDISSKTGKGYPIIYSETNTVPPKLNAWRKPGAPREEANAIQINPNGEQYMVRIAEIEHPENQVCTTTSNSANDG